MAPPCAAAAETEREGFLQNPVRSGGPADFQCPIADPFHSWELSTLFILRDRKQPILFFPFRRYKRNDHYALGGHFICVVLRWVLPSSRSYSYCLRLSSSHSRLRCRRQTRCRTGQESSTVPDEARAEDQSPDRNSGWSR